MKRPAPGKMGRSKRLFIKYFPQLVSYRWPATPISHQCQLYDTLSCIEKAEYSISELEMVIGIMRSIISTALL